MSKVNYEPSELSLALLSGVCDGATKEEAMAVAKEAGEYARAAMRDILSKYPATSLYVMQTVGELMLATVTSTLQTLVDQQKG